MKQYTKRLVVVALLVSLASLLVALPVLAIADPDSPTQINAVYVYQFSDGSVGVLIDYYIDYAALPTENASQSYMAVFIDTDGATHLKSAVPYVYVDSGYHRGLMWIPFTAAEVVTYSLDSADIALYRVWVVGNPALTWVPGPNPPRTIATIDQWNTAGDMTVLLALRILYYADVLELAWSLNLVEATASGNRLTTLGEEYFENVIPGVRSLAPGAFSSTTTSPNYIPISYDTVFGATATSGTATIVGSPVTLVSGNNTIDTGATTGTIILDLAQWTFGTCTNGTGTVAGSPVTLYPGVNTLNVTGAGTFTVAVAVQDTATRLASTVTGTGMDLTTLATQFGMSRWMFSGLVWVLISIVVCAGLYVAGRRGELEGTEATRVVMIVFAIMLIGGTLLGMLHPLVTSLLVIAYGAFIGYILFFRSETLHKGMMFMIWMFVITSIAGNVAASGQSPIVATRLTAAISSTEATTIAVASTAGFPDSGVLRIGDEQLTYPNKDATHFLAGTWNPIVRGSGGTIAAAHASRATVRTRESWILNASIDYKIAQITDSAGALGFIALPIRLLDLVLTFLRLPLEFLGTDLAILAYIWMVVAIGMIIGFVITMVGSRRV